MPKTYNPYCIVNFYYYQCFGQMLYCKDCPLENCECKKVRCK